MLARTRVLDLTRVLAGPLCTMILGDLGADVLKVERPDGGDETRGWGPPFDARGESAYYLSVNRNKLSVTADLDAPDDQALLRRLIAGADVVVDNYRPGALERRGLDPAGFLDAHRGLVWCTITGFGPTSSRPGYDFVVQAERGWMAITGEPGGEPMKTGVALADVLAGKDAALAVLGALVGVAQGRLAAPEERRLTRISSLTSSSPPPMRRSSSPWGATRSGRRAPARSTRRLSPTTRGSARTQGVSPTAARWRPRSRRASGCDPRPSGLPGSTLPACRRGG
jgi:hypothetical protein